MASLFGGLSGLGRGIGAIGVGVGQGQLKGEQEAWRRKQQEDAMALRTLLAQKPVRQPEEDEPLPLKTLFEGERAVMASADPTARLNWERSGQAEQARVVRRAYTEGYLKGGLPAARAMALGAMGITGRPVGEDVSSPLDDLARSSGRMTAPQKTTIGGQEITLPGRNDLDYIRPTHTGATATYSPLTDARTAGVLASTKRIETLLPHEVEDFKQGVLTDTLGRDLKMRDFNWDKSVDTFKMWMDQFKALIEKGQGDYRAVAGVYGNLLNMQQALQQAGAQQGKELDRYLLVRSPDGTNILNADLLRQRLAGKYSPEEIEFVIRSYGNSTGTVSGAPAGGAVGASPASNIPAENRGAAANRAVAGTPTLPPIAGAPGAPSPAIPGWALGKNANVQGMASNAREALSWAVQELMGAGIKPRIESAHRDSKKQAQLYAAYKAGKGPVAAPPGSSTHEHGTGVDIHVPKNKQAQLEQVMGARGYVRTVDSEPWHFEYQGSGQQTTSPSGAATTTSFPPGGSGAPTPASVGVNTPATAPQPQNPYDQNSQPFEWNVITALMNGTPAQQIADRFRNAGRHDDAARVQSIADNYQRQQGASFFGGIPTPNANGARIPTPPSPGGLQYDPAAFAQYGIGATAGNVQPGVPTRAMTNAVVGQQPEVIVEPADPGDPYSAPADPAALMVTTPVPPAPPPAPPAGPTIPVPPPTDRSGPNMMAAPSGRGLEGPNLMGSVPRRSPAGPPLTGTSKGKGEKGPRVGVKGLDEQASEFQARVAKRLEQKPSGNEKAYREQIAKHEKQDFAPGIKKWLSKHKIQDPATVLAVYEEALKNFAKKVAGAPKGQRASRMFKLLDEQLKPAS